MDKMKIVIFGTGKFYRENKKYLSSKDEIILFLDNAVKTPNAFVDGIQVVLPSRIREYKYDGVLLMGNEKNSASMKRQLIQIGVPENRITFFFEYILGEKTSNDSISGDVLIISPYISYVGGIIAEVYAVQAMKNIGLSTVIVSCGGEKGTFNEIRNKGIKVAIVPDISFLSDAEYIELTNRFLYVMINTFQMYRCVKAISQYRTLLWWIHEPSEFYERLVDDEKQIIENICFSNVRIMAVSKLAQNNFNQYVKDAISECLPYGIPDHSLAINSFECKRILRIGVIGTIYKTKGQDIFLEALAQLTQKDQKRIECFIVGNIGDKQYAKEIIEKAESFDNVKITGLLNREQMNSLEPTIDVFVSPSREDSLPIVIAEGLMYGKVCMVSDHTGFKDFIIPYENGLIFKSESSEDLAIKIEWVIRNTNKLGVIGKNGRKLYDSIFGMEKFGERLKTAIEDI